MLQSVVALSTTEAEYMTFIEALKETLWLRGTISKFGINQKGWKLTVIVRVLYILLNIKCFISDQNTLMFVIILSGMLLTNGL